jgi:hypothetical protein
MVAGLAQALAAHATNENECFPPHNFILSERLELRGFESCGAVEDKR